VLALMHCPKLLIFDEPVASLDPMARRDFLRALIESDADDAQAPTVVISSHLLEDLERVATHLLFLRDGRVQLIGIAKSCPKTLSRCTASRRRQRRRG
jgi:ABC-2 type transport system ATP-binding protein